MKILIDLTSLAYNITGIERYALCITQEMIKIDKNNEYILLFKDEVYSELKEFCSRKNVKSVLVHGKNRLLFQLVSLPFALYKIKADIYLFMAFPSPAWFFKKGIYNTIHDMGCWDMPKAMKLTSCMFFRGSYRVAAWTSTGIITVSEFSKQRIHQILHVPNKKISVIPSGIASKFSKTRSEEGKEKIRYNLPTRYIMSLSTLEPRKNLSLLLRAYEKVMDMVDYDLVLVGRRGWKIDKFLNESHRLRERVHITGFVPDEDVIYIYKNAICFVFPSLYEGFGLPPLEALALGTPVIASNATSIPEVLRNQAVFFENDSLESLYEKLLGLNKNLEKMPNSLDNYQKENYKFEKSAKLMLKFLNRNI